MSPDYSKPAAKPTGKDETQSSSGRKTGSARPQEPALKCPRCDSPNTKFCYYNNYSLAQPRHFCKTCRRYWTKGGALRNVPIGGGCRKNKKLKPSPRLSTGDSKDSVGSSDAGGLKFFQGISPAMDFQLGGLDYPRFQGSPNTGLFSQFSSFGDISNTCGAISSSPNFSLDPNNSGVSPSAFMGFGSFPFSSGAKQGEGNGIPFQEMGSLNVHSSLASSIESLSSINQDLHWKLQQQRLAMLPSIEPAQVQKPQPITFDISKQESCTVGTTRKDDACGSLSTEWFFDNSFAAMPQTTATSSSNLNQNTSNWRGIQAWSNDLSHYTASLP